MNSRWSDADWMELYNERAAGTYVEIEKLRVTSEQVQAKQRAMGTMAKQKADEQSKQEQITLPGFEMAFGGG